MCGDNVLPILLLLLVCGGQCGNDPCSSQLGVSDTSTCNNNLILAMCLCILGLGGGGFCPPQCPGI
ncbi:MAG: hypothetical protein PHC84_01525 [Clostridia bacterium]|nr:hypothetical protein [Clostridia bacterium]